ncbi:hypothetical protein DFH09DRAFT_1104381 [Mycena vulgaris]|nr:hypothetical protein DFH09DRAFT_1104381 [Mycena vulgaris]
MLSGARRSGCGFGWFFKSEFGRANIFDWNKIRESMGYGKTGIKTGIITGGIDGGLADFKFHTTAVFGPASRLPSFTSCIPIIGPYQDHSTQITIGGPPERLWTHRSPNQYAASTPLASAASSSACWCVSQEGHSCTGKGSAARCSGEASAFKKERRKGATEHGTT